MGQTGTSTLYGWPPDTCHGLAPASEDYPDRPATDGATAAAGDVPLGAEAPSDDPGPLRPLQAGHDDAGHGRCGARRAGGPPPPRLAGGLFGDNRGRYPPLLTTNDAPGPDR